MNKNKIIMAAIGGVALVAVLVFGYLAFAAWSEAGETRESVETECANEKRLLSENVPPTAASLERLNANTDAVKAWLSATRERLAAGDVKLDRASSATSFKAMMGDDARLLAKLPGGVEGKLVRDNFDFGFKSYIIDGNIPPEATLGTLKREWAEVKAMTEMLAASGIVELQAVEIVTAPAKVEAPKEAPKRRGFGAKRPPKVAEPAKSDFETIAYTLRFTARPLALVKALNAFAASEHLMYITSLTLVREKDMLGEMLGAGKKAEEASPRRRRRGRRAEAAAENAEGEGEETQRKGLVTDPVLESPFVVTLRVETIDFGTNGSGEAAEKPAEKSEEKEDEE